MALIIGYSTSVVHKKYIISDLSCVHEDDRYLNSLISISAWDIDWHVDTLLDTSCLQGE